MLNVLIVMVGICICAALLSHTHVHITISHKYPNTTMISDEQIEDDSDKDVKEAEKQHVNMDNVVAQIQKMLEVNDFGE